MFIAAKNGGDGPQKQGTGELSLPGPFERDRLLGLELRAGALDGAWGMIAASGAEAPLAKPRLVGKARKLAAHAA